MLDPPTNIIVSSQPPWQAPLIGPQSDLSTNSRVRSYSYQQASQGQNTPCPLRSLGIDKSQLTMMIEITMTEEMLMGVPVPVGKQPSAITLTGPRVPVVDLSWHYLPRPFSLGQIFKKRII